MVLGFQRMFRYTHAILYIWNIIQGSGRRQIKILLNTVFWVVVSIIFYFNPYLGKMSNLTIIFQMGWNHQLVFCWIESFLQVLKHELYIFTVYSIHSSWSFLNSCFCLADPSPGVMDFVERCDLGKPIKSSWGEFKMAKVQFQLGNSWIICLFCCWYMFFIAVFIDRTNICM